MISYFYSYSCDFVFSLPLTSHLIYRNKVILISLLNFMNAHCEPYLKIDSFREEIIMSGELLLYFSI